jgi:hypothetical protein
MRDRDLLGWAAMLACIAVTAQGEWSLAVAAGFSPAVAAGLPIAVDCYALRALEARREILPPVALMIATNIAAHLVAGGVLTVTPWLIAAVSAVAPVVLWRVKALRHKAEPPPVPAPAPPTEVPPAPAPLPSAPPPAVPPGARPLPIVARPVPAPTPVPPPQARAVPPAVPDDARLLPLVPRPGTAPPSVPAPRSSPVPVPAGVRLLPIVPRAATAVPHLEVHPLPWPHPAGDDTGTGTARGTGRPPARTDRRRPPDTTRPPAGTGSQTSGTGTDANRRFAQHVEQARQWLAEDPDLTGTAIGQRLGTGASYGRRVRRAALAAPVPA